MACKKYAIKEKVLFLLLMFLEILFVKYVKIVLSFL